MSTTIDAALARSSVWIVLAVLVLPVASASETVAGWLARRDPMATTAEIATTAAWSHDHMLGSVSSPAFSFVLDGRASKELLPAWERTQTRRAADGRVEEHTIAYRDRTTGLVCTCTATVYRDCAAIDWVLGFENQGTEDTPIIERIQPLDVTLAQPQPCTITLHRSLGDSNSKDSFRPIEDVLTPAGRIVLAPGGGRSSDAHMPFFNLDWQSGGVALAVGWSGQWEAEFTGTDDRTVTLRAGQQRCRLRLKPGESIRTPRMLLIFWEGNDPIRGNHVMRRTILEHYAPRRNGELVVAPICGSVGVTDPDGTYEGPHLRVMAPYAERGIEVFWSDMDPQQWYPGGFPAGTGTWEVDTAKYPRGLAPVGEAARAAGLEYLLWFEPERVHFGTQIELEHPEWVLKPSGEWSQLFAMHIPKARAWLTDKVDRHVADAKLSWIRWDFNIDPLGFWRRTDPPEREGMTEIKYVEGLYTMWDTLRERHPGLVIDQCASGGRRLDLESLSRGIPLWHSDSQCTGAAPATDQLQNAGLWRWLPMHGCGNFGLEPSYEFRSAMTTGNILCALNDGRLAAVGESGGEDAVTRTVALYKALRPYWVGDFYPLTPHDASESVWFAYQFHRPDLDAGAVVAFRRSSSDLEAHRLRLRGVDAAARYKLRDQDTAAQVDALGRELLQDGLRITIPDRPGSTILVYERL